MKNADDLIQFFQSALLQTLGKELDILRYAPVYGGSINHSFKIDTSDRSYFIKWNTESDAVSLFEMEVDGLKKLSIGPISTPEIIGIGKASGIHFLILEFIEKSAPSPRFWEDFGEKLAHQHRITEKQYGYHSNNHIGILPQQNDWSTDWIDFFINCRLEPQLGLAYYNGHLDLSFMDKFRKIYRELPSLIPKEPISLLHGDLWSGNFMIGKNGDAVIFDPAVYYGHREMELAFTHLFGGFDVSFYHTYDQTFPVAPGFFDRIDIYNLYPLLVHVNLFGGSYLQSVSSTIKRFT